MFDADIYQATISDGLVTSNCPLIVIDTERSIQAASQINTVAHRLGRHFKSFFVPKRKIRSGPILPLTQQSGSNSFIRLSFRVHTPQIL